VATATPVTSSLPHAPSPAALSTPSLLGEAVSETRELVRLELALARQELSEELVQIRRAATWGAAALVLGLVFLATLALALVLALGGTALVALGVAGALLAIAGGLGVVCWRALPKALLRRSRARLQEDFLRLEGEAGLGAARRDAPSAGPSAALGHDAGSATAAAPAAEQALAPSARGAAPAGNEPSPGLGRRLASAASTLKQTGLQWSNDDAARLAASLALYTLLSVAPLLVIAVSVAGMVFGAEAARGQISRQMSTIVGPEAGKAIEGLVAHAQSPSTGILSTVVGTVVLLFGASGVFGELQSALNRIWQVKPKPGRGIIGMLRDRFLSFSMVMGVAFLLLVSMLVSAALAGITGYFQSVLPLPVLWQAVDVGVGLLLATGIFALMFKVVPDVKISWRDVWVGGLATALAFSIGRVALAWYVGRSATASPFGAAGSLVALVVWIYYSAQILFLGAEFAQVYAVRHGSRIVPSGNAVPLDQGSGGAGARGVVASS
jgi:membrane protein